MSLNHMFNSHVASTTTTSTTYHTDIAPSSPSHPTTTPQDVPSKSSTIHRSAGGGGVKGARLQRQQSLKKATTAALDDALGKLAPGLQFAALTIRRVEADHSDSVEEAEKHASEAEKELRQLGGEYVEIADRLQAAIDRPASQAHSSPSVSTVASKALKSTDASTPSSSSTSTETVSTAPPDARRAGDRRMAGSLMASLRPSGEKGRIKNMWTGFMNSMAGGLRFLRSEPMLQPHVNSADVEDLESAMREIEKSETSTSATGTQRGLRNLVKRYAALGAGIVRGLGGTTGDAVRQQQLETEARALEELSENLDKSGTVSLPLTNDASSPITEAGSKYATAADFKDEKTSTSLKPPKTPSVLSVKTPSNPVVSGTKGGGTTSEEFLTATGSTSYHTTPVISEEEETPTPPTSPKTPNTHPSQTPASSGDDKGTTGKTSSDTTGKTSNHATAAGSDDSASYHTAPSDDGGHVPTVPGETKPGHTGEAAEEEEPVPGDHLVDPHDPVAQAEKQEEMLRQVAEIEQRMFELELILKIIKKSQDIAIGLI